MRTRLLGILVLLLALTITAVADSFRSHAIIDTRTPGKLDCLLNGRPLPTWIARKDGCTRFDGSVDVFLVAGENVVEIRKAATSSGQETPASEDVTDDPASVAFRLSIHASGSGSSWREIQYFSKKVERLPCRFTFVGTTAWPIIRQPWQDGATAFTERDRDDIHALLGSIAECYGSLESAVAREALYNLKRLEYEHRAALDGLSKDDKKRVVYAIWSRMAPFAAKSQSDFTHFVVESIPGVNLATAAPPGGRYTYPVFADGSFFGDCAAKIATKRHDGTVPLPQFFTKRNGQWFSLPGGADAEATFIGFEEGMGPLEKPSPRPPRHVASIQTLPADDEGPAWEESRSPGGGAVRWRIVRNPQTNIVRSSVSSPIPKISFSNDDPPDTAPGTPGYGAPGKIEPYATDPKLEPYLRKYGLTAWWFVRDPLPVGTQGEYFTRRSGCTNGIPFLLYTPKPRGTQKMPVVTFIPGKGETGTDLSMQFRQKTIFEVVTAPDFQQKRPCYLFVPMPPHVGSLRSSMSNRLSDESALINDALLKVVAMRRSPAIDPNRIYLTGLSFGATAVYDFASIIPERFAACVPISSVGTATHLHPAMATCFWHFHNEKDITSPIIKTLLKDLKSGVEARGGELTISTFPDSGHDAWTKAWREEAVWDWVFGKRSIAASGRVFEPENTPPGEGVRQTPSCSSTIPGDEPDHGLDRLSDGLQATYYQSAEPAAAGAYVLLEYPRPVQGTFAITSGTPDERQPLVRGFADVSPDGRLWTKAGAFRLDGTCRFVQRSPIRFVRIGHASPAAQPMVIREVSLEK